MNNRLFCTFCNKGELEDTVELIKSKYTILFSKIFVLNFENEDEYICTYNIDQFNTSKILNGTILAHRKKETNTLYTINALNNLIKQLNNGVLDINYKINWPEYNNSFLLHQDNSLRILKTTVHKIIFLQEN